MQEINKRICYYQILHFRKEIIIITVLGAAPSLEQHQAKNFRP
jgi:hypothetical protein